MDFSEFQIWKKETIGETEMFSCLVQFDGPEEKIIHDFPSKCAEKAKKSDERATELRVAGNEMYKQKKFNEALELYNESLRYAITGSENLSFGYANRSLCFLHLGKYKECLSDIKLAMESNYPQRLKSKLKKRIMECKFKRQLSCADCVNCRAEIEEWKETLEFDRDEHFPCMANVLEIKYNEEFGRHIVAKETLKVGQIISAEEAFHFDATDFGKTCCKTCLKHTTNLIPCPNCTFVMFCDDNCMQSSKIHQMTCGAAYLRQSDDILVIESILIAINAFTSIDDLMEFVEQALATRNDVNSTESYSTPQSKYGLFLKLWSQPPKMDKDTLVDISILYLRLLQIPEIMNRFDTKQKRQFLQHLIWHHISIINANGCAYSGMFAGSTKIVSINFMFVFKSFFNHSCYPNINFARRGNKFYGYVIRPIKEGEQLVKSYVDERTQDDCRRAALRDKYQFECKCSKCEPCLDPDDHRMIRDYSEYQEIADIEDETIDNKWRRPEIREQCSEFLMEYGHLPWAKEIEEVLRKYEQCMNVDFTSNY